MSEFARAGKAAVRIPNGSSLEIYMGRDTALGPRLSYVDDESGLALEARSFTQSHDSQADLRRALDRDGVPNSTIVAESLQIYRLTLEDTVTQAEVAEAMLVLGGIPQFAFARLAHGDAVSICSATLGFDGLFWNPRQRVARLTWQTAGEDELLGGGWHWRQADNLRWTTGTAELLLPFWRIGSLRVSVEATTLDWLRDGELGTVGLRMNGQEFSKQPLNRGWGAVRVGRSKDCTARGAEPGLSHRLFGAPAAGGLGPRVRYRG